MPLELMYHGQIKVTASDANRGEAWRLDRLSRVIGYVGALADHFGNRDVLDKVENIHDHEGQLTIAWKQSPLAGEREFFVKAWESKIGDGADNVDHVLLKR